MVQYRTAIDRAQCRRAIEASFGLNLRQSQPCDTTLSEWSGPGRRFHRQDVT
jgi:hypothetical protein